MLRAQTVTCIIEPTGRQIGGPRVERSREEGVVLISDDRPSNECLSEILNSAADSVIDHRLGENIGWVTLRLSDIHSTNLPPEAASVLESLSVIDR